MARSLRGLTASALASQAGVTPEWISKIEAGTHTPSDELTGRLAHALGLPVSFFFREAAPVPDLDGFFFRASSKLAKKDEAAARALASLASEVSDWMDDTYHLPLPGIPEIQELVGGEIEVTPEIAANALRAHWGLGVAPISTMLALLESKGARIFTVSGTYQHIDAFSFRHRASGIVFLNPSKSAERLRFDLAHELGHLVLHGGSLYQRDAKHREKEANEFASSFLMPRAGIAGALRGNVSVADITRLRDTWRVSAMAVTYRLQTVGTLSDWSYRLMCQQLAQAGYRRGEPGSRLAPEVSSLWSQVLADLRSQKLGIHHVAQIIDSDPEDVRSLLVGLVPMSLAGGRVPRGPSQAKGFDTSAPLRAVPKL